MRKIIVLEMIAFGIGSAFVGLCIADAARGDVNALAMTAALAIFVASAIRLYRSSSRPIGD